MIIISLLLVSILLLPFVSPSSTDSIVVEDPGQQQSFTPTLLFNPFTDKNSYVPTSSAHNSEISPSPNQISRKINATPSPTSTSPHSMRYGLEDSVSSFDSIPRVFSFNQEPEAISKTSLEKDSENSTPHPLQSSSPSSSSEILYRNPQSLRYTVRSPKEGGDVEQLKGDKNLQPRSKSKCCIIL